MSNSSLATYTRISPNRTSPRNHEIDTISIHCAVGQLTAKQILDMSHFVNYSENNGSSCNYAIGKDGSIGIGVEEKDRSWCTSSRSNDHRAITIEVASDTFAPYKVTDEAYNALIKLLVDICKRNKIKELKWEGDKSLIGKVDKQNMTVHRWFANKACPGDYLYNLHGQIAKEVNSFLLPSSNILYRVQTGAFRSKSNADAMLSKVKAAGFTDAYMTKSDELYRIQVGAYSKKANADKMANEIEKKGFEAYVTSKGGTAVTSTTKKSIDAIAREVIAGKWGNGEDRKKRLTAAGYDYKAVQKRINELI